MVEFYKVLEFSLSSEFSTTAARGSRRRGSFTNTMGLVDDQGAAADAGGATPLEEAADEGAEGEADYEDMG